MACKSNDACGAQAYDSLMNMRKTMDVSELKKKFDIHRIKSGLLVNGEKAPVQKQSRRSRLKLSEEQLKIVRDGSLPVKPREMISSIFGRGFDGDYLLKSLKAGVNPYLGQTPVILEKAFDMLLNGGFSKKQLHTTYMEMGMAKRTAHSQVSIVVAALKILGVVNENIGTGRVKFEGEQ
ncbi:MAG: hypothetical protein HRT93_10860 [Piscirickettsiaceae bacterium]|nr:hypothetical protein [Piscirickettsiaceae bacterium]